MRHFSKNECPLDVISIAEHCCRGEVINWLTFVLNEIFEACEDIYKRSTNFIFGYILMTLAIWKWRPLRERDMMKIRDDQPITLRYGPWRALGDTTNKEINEKAFTELYGLMLITNMMTKRIPKQLLDKFSQSIWFGVTHGHTYLRLRCIHTGTFQMWL